MEKLKESVELPEGNQEKNEVRLGLLEERVAELKVQNIELKDRINLVINGHNRVIQFLNNRFPALPPVDTAPQPAVQQVHDMYLTQPSTEEDWQDMTEAFEAAREYGAAMAEQLFNPVNGDNT